MVKWNIATFARIRPPRRGYTCANFHLRKSDPDTTTISFPPPDDDDERINLKQRDTLEFAFHDIFDPGASQDAVFANVCESLVHSALDGFNGTLLAYGQTGSGKTYTMTGGEHYADRGLIPRVLSTLFEEIEQRANVRYTCFVSYLEIYNESVYDLLDRSHADRPIEEWTKVLLLDDDEGELHFRNLGVFEAVSEEEALNLLFLGNMNRVTSDTPMNQASSRSHSIFSVMLEARPLDSDVIVTSKLHLVDLAGSERVYKREGTQRMRTEGKHINLSLHHLEQVILSLRAASKSTVSKAYHVPYRNSMLTSVLRGSLGGNCKSVFIATLNPEAEFVEESISTCRFMQRCAEVTVDLTVNTEIDADKRVDALEKKNAELEAARFELQARLVQVETDLKAAHEQNARWQQEQAAREQQRLQQQQLDVDWAKCETLVEHFLLTGDLTRADITPSSLRSADRRNADDARRVFIDVTDEIRRLGMESALACLTVLKEHTVFASNTTIELQETMEKQTAAMQTLETRLQDQKRDAERLNAQLQEMLQAQARESDRESEHDQGRERDRQHARRRQTIQPRSTASSDRARHTKSSRTNESDNESDSDLDSVVPESHQYPHPTQARSSQDPAPPLAAPIRPMPVMPLPPQTTAVGLQTEETAVSKPLPPPTSIQPTNKSGSDLIRRRLDLLKAGSLFVKYGRYGKPHVRFVWCSADLEYLNYRQANAQMAKASIPTRSLQRVMLGQTTKVFERAKQPSRDPFCFSVEYEDKRTLDLEIADGESSEQKKTKRTEWSEALQFLIKLKTASRPAPPPSADAASSASAGALGTRGGSGGKALSQ